MRGLFSPLPLSSSLLFPTHFPVLSPPGIILDPPKVLGMQAKEILAMPECAKD